MNYLGRSFAFGVQPSGLGLSNKNKIINPGMAIDSRNSSATPQIIAGAALAYMIDQWYAYSTGANVTGQHVASGGLYLYQLTGASGVTGIGFGQRMETANSADLAGGTATLSVNLANSLLTTVTWTAYYANSTDSFGTLAAPTKTQIATGTFAVSSTLARYIVPIAIPAAATTGIEIVFTVGAQTSGTWMIGNVQLEAGTQATPLERRLIGQEIALCQRYYFAYAPPASADYFSVMASGQPYLVYALSLPVMMRTTPTVTFSAVAGSGSFASGSPYLSASTPSRIVLRGDVSAAGGYVYLAGLTASAVL